MDLEKIEDIMKMLDESGATEISISKGNGSVDIRKSKTELLKYEMAMKADEELKEAPAPEDASVRTIYSSMVGTFAHAENPIGPGTKVKVGDIIGAVESMKLRTDIISDCEGTVLEVLVIDGMPVEYRQPLFKVKIAN